MLLQNATHLTSRPLLHCSLIPLIFLLLSLTLGRLFNNNLIMKLVNITTKHHVLSSCFQGFLTFSCLFSHHLRDGSRRGMWLGAGVSIGISYSSYIMFTLLLPLFLRIVMKTFCDDADIAHGSRYSSFILQL